MRWRRSDGGLRMAARFSGGGGLGIGVAYLLLLGRAALTWPAVAAAAAASSANSKQRREVEKYLKRINKAAVKTIQSPDGDTIDCVHILEQPAFDHPFLNDHKVRLKQNVHVVGLSDATRDEVPKNSKQTINSNNIIGQLWHNNGKCPKSTIPIRRTKEENVLKASSSKMYGKKKPTSMPTMEEGAADPMNPDTHEYAIAYVGGDNYYGAKATINVWKPQIQDSNEYTLSQIWILSGLNTIEAGWQVNPSIYGDNNTRLFTYWSSDAYQATGCYNLLCSGFIQTSDQIALGASISPISTNSRNQQYDITLLIWKDPTSGDWFLQFNNEIILGYWPSKLFTDLADSASMIQWGGEVVNLKIDGMHTTTQMGSGGFPENGYGNASYFDDVKVVDGSLTLKSPGDLFHFTSRWNCYDVRIEKDSFFYYGGPGRNADCP